MVNLPYEWMWAAHTVAFREQAWGDWLQEVSWASLSLPIWGAGRKETNPTTCYTSKNVEGGNQPVTPSSEGATRVSIADSRVEIFDRVRLVIFTIYPCSMFSAGTASQLSQIELFVDFR